MHWIAFNPCDYEKSHMLQKKNVHEALLFYVTHEIFTTSPSSSSLIDVNVNGADDSVDG
jgi:hypothetical protein